MASIRDADVEMSTIEAGGGGPAPEKENPFGKRSRLSMFILLSAIAGASIVFSAKEQQAETTVWKNDMKVVRNGTSVAEQKPMRYSTVSKMSWQQGAQACKAYGGELCKWHEVCNKGVAATKYLCPDQSCVGLETPAKQKDRFIPISGRAPGTFGRVNDCSFAVFPVKKEVSAVVACCGTVKSDGSAYSKGERDSYAKKRAFEIKSKGPKAGGKETTSKYQLPGRRGIMPVHQAPVIQRAVMKGKISVLPTKAAKGGPNKGNVGGGSVGVAKVGTKGESKGIWQLQNHIRTNDPFMKAKQSGGRPMQSFHSHIAKHLGNETVSAVTKHFNSFTSGMAQLVNNMKSSVKMENKNQTATHGSVSHHLRESDPFMKKDANGGKQKTKIAPLHKALNTSSIAQHAHAIGNHVKNVIGTFTKAAQKSRDAKMKKTESLKGLKDAVAVDEEKDDKRKSISKSSEKVSSKLSSSRNSGSGNNLIDKQSGSSKSQTTKRLSASQFGSQANPKPKTGTGTKLSKAAQDKPLNGAKQGSKGARDSVSDKP